MSIKVILFDLDGTLLPMNQEIFTKTYFKAISASLSQHGFKPKMLIDSIWAGTKAMVKNNGTKSNEEVFWETFSKIYGNESLKIKPYFDEFYKTDFEQVKKSCGFNPKAAQTVRKLKESGFRIALATNPIFPSIATEARIRWCNLLPEEFELYTSYENIGFSKPNCEYYKELIKRLDIEPCECLMVGNDVLEDMVAKNAGMNVFLLTDCLINKENFDISSYPNGDFSDLTEYIEKLQHNIQIT